MQISTHRYLSRPFFAQTHIIVSLSKKQMTQTLYTLIDSLSFTLNDLATHNLIGEMNYHLLNIKYKKLLYDTWHPSTSLYNDVIQKSMMPLKGQRLWLKVNDTAQVYYFCLHYLVKLVSLTLGQSHRLTNMA